MIIELILIVFLQLGLNIPDLGRISDLNGCVVMHRKYAMHCVPTDHAKHRNQSIYLIIIVQGFTIL